MTYNFETFSELVEWVNGVEDQFEECEECLIVVDGIDAYIGPISYNDISFDLNYDGYSERRGFALLTA